MIDLINRAGIDQKMLRADKHLNALRRGIVSFVKVNPCAIVGQNEGNPARYVLRAQVAPMPPDIAIIVGDAVHNLRSALDHLAWQLVISAGGSPDRFTQFPILLDALGKKGPCLADVAGGISSGALALVESLQPYNRVDDPTLDPLAILAELSNFDKHRMVVLTELLVTDPSTGITFGGDPANYSYVTSGRFENDAIITTLPFAAGPGDDVDVNARCSTEVAIRQPFELNVPALEELFKLPTFLREKVIEPLIVVA